jgi:hypothetical protein
MITLDDLITSSGRYKDRAKSPELTAEKLENGKKLLERVNALLTELGVTDISVSSGFRTSTSNAATKGAAKHSHHMDCSAIDLADADGKLEALMDKHQELVVKHGLYREIPSSTPTWVHLQDVPTRSNPFHP